MDPAIPAARALLAGAAPSAVATIDGEDYTITTIREDPATVWFRLWNQNCAANDRLYLKVGAATVKEVQHVQRAKQFWRGRFSLFTVQPRDVNAAVSVARAGKAVLVKVTKEVY